jgi:hypothetical protein
MKNEKRTAIKADDEILDETLSAIVRDIEATLSRFQNWVKVEIEKRNGAPQTIRITAEFNVR